MMCFTFFFFAVFAVVDALLLLAEVAARVNAFACFFNVSFVNRICVDCFVFALVVGFFVLALAVDVFVLALATAFAMLAP